MRQITLPNGVFLPEVARLLHEGESVTLKAKGNSITLIGEGIAQIDFNKLITLNATAAHLSGKTASRVRINRNYYKVLVEIENGAVKGEMSERALRLILEWLSLHREDLKEAWEKASRGEEPGKIEPLK